MKQSRHQGFSLLELALGLFVLGFLFALMPMMLSNLGQLQSANPAADPLESGHQALLGFVIQHDRLPCPDQDSDGLEDCNGGRSGYFPYRTVKLGRPLVNSAGYALYYGVYQHTQANLTAPQSSYQPSLLNGSQSVQSNGLDFCQGLRLGLTAGLQPTEVSVQNIKGGPGINPAFVLVDPGRLDADRDTRLFDGSNASGLQFESAGRAQGESYDDRLLVTGFAELSARLQCPELLARVSAATLDANAAYDMERAYGFYRQFREFGVEVRKKALDVANTRHKLALANGAISAVMVASDTASALTNPGGAAAVAVYAANTVLTVIAIEEEVTDAIDAVDDKTDELAEAKKQLTAAEKAEEEAQTYLTATVKEVLDRDAKGWFQ